MTTLREAAQLALEALEYGQHSLKQISEYQWESRGQLAMDALKAALEQPEPAQEPVAWAHPTQGFVRWRTETIQPEVVASYERAGWTPLSLYTAPQPQRPPLTDDEINEIAQTNLGDYRDGEWHLLFARAIERKLKGE